MDDTTKLIGRLATLLHEANHEATRRDISPGMKNTVLIQAGSALREQLDISTHATRDEIAAVIRARLGVRDD
jgi:hypothetical protein